MQIATSSTTKINQKELALAKLVGAQARYRDALREYAHSMSAFLRFRKSKTTAPLSEHWAMWVEHDKQDVCHYYTRMQFFEQQAIEVSRK